MSPIPAKISRALHDYLTDWIAWVERGAPDGKPYWRYAGLCGNVPTDEIRAELSDIFRRKYPFGGRAAFDRDEANSTQHLNEHRLAWVRETIRTAEIEE